LKQVNPEDHYQWFQRVPKAGMGGHTVVDQGQQQKGPREQPGGRAKLAATDIAIDIQQYTHAGPDGTISIAIAGALARANA